MERHEEGRAATAGTKYDRLWKPAEPRNLAASRTLTRVNR